MAGWRGADLTRIERRSAPRLGALKPPAASEALLRELRVFVLPWRTLTIGIDGRMGAGKSTLGRFIAWQLGMPLIETDMWMHRRHLPIGYRYSELAQIVRARRADERPTIIEGVKLLETLERIDVRCDFLIWLRSNEDPTSEEELSEILRSGTRVADVESYIRSYDPESHASRVLKIVPAE